MFDGQWSSADGDIKNLTFYVTLQNHVIEASSNFMNGSSSRYITTISNLVAIGIVEEGFHLTLPPHIFPSK